MTIDQAQSAALARVPGTLTDTRLDSDRGRVVYDIEIANAYGVIENVKLDAGNGRVLTVKTVSNPIPIGDEMEAP